jgi:hypothetical protein
MYRAILLIIGLMAMLPVQADVFDNCNSSASFNSSINNVYNSPDFTVIYNGFLKGKDFRFGYSMTTTRSNTDLDRVTWAGYSYGTKPILYTNRIHGGALTSKSFTATTKKYAFRVSSATIDGLICAPQITLTIITNGGKLGRMTLDGAQIWPHTVITNYDNFGYGHDQIIYKNVRAFLNAVKRRSKKSIFKQLAIPYPLGAVYQKGKLRLRAGDSLYAYHAKPVVVHCYQNEAGEITIASKKQYLKYYGEIFTPAFRRWASIQASGLLLDNRYGPYLDYVQFNSDGKVTGVAIVPEQTLNIPLNELAKMGGFFQHPRLPECDYLPK